MCSTHTHSHASDVVVRAAVIPLMEGVYDLLARIGIKRVKMRFTHRCRHIPLRAIKSASFLRTPQTPALDSMLQLRLILRGRVVSHAA
jgi:hypothetical protein